MVQCPFRRLDACVEVLRRFRAGEGQFGDVGPVGEKIEVEEVQGVNEDSDIVSRAPLQLGRRRGW